MGRPLVGPASRRAVRSRRWWIIQDPKVVADSSGHSTVASRWRGRLRLASVRQADVVGAMRDIAAAVVIAVLTWPVAKTGPSLAIDPSWIVGLHLAARQGLHFGDQILFTYGPLGFLGYPQPYLAWTSAAALLFVGTVHLVACLGLFRLARQAVGGPAAWVLVLVTAFTFPWIAGWTTLGVIVFLASAAAVARRDQRPTGLAFAAALGAMVGFALVGKLNIGFVSLVIAGIGVGATAREPRRSLPTFGAAAAVVFLSLWIGSGQLLPTLVEYLRGALEVSVGYGQSMGQIDPQASWAAAIAGLATAILAGLVWVRASELRRRDRLILWLLCAMMGAATFKAGFTRLGVGMTIYVVTLFATWPVLVLRKASPIAAGIPVAGMLAMVLALNALPIGALIDPATRVQALLDETNTALFGRTTAANANAKALRTLSGLPPEATNLLAGQTVDIHPWQTAIAYAYPEFLWRPEPVFQDYSAYTPFLDQENADFLAGTTAPDRILWITGPDSPLSIDGRSLWFDSPMAKIQMVCRYVPVASSTNWQVLGRVTNRCGSPIVAGSTTATAGVPIAVPSSLPPGILTIRISGMGKDPVSQLVSLAYRSPAWWLTEGSSVYRVPLGINGEPAILAATVDVGYTGALALTSPPATVTITPDPGAPGQGSPLTVVFEVIPVITTN